MKTVKLWLTKGKFTIIPEEDFLWAQQWYWHFAKSPHNPDDGYARRSRIINKINEHYFLHIELMKYWGRYIEGMDVDHIDRDKLNNTPDNLRMVTRSQNTMNTGLRTNNISGHTGVHFDKSKNKHIAGIRINGRKYNLGTYDTEEAAIEARRLAEIEYFDEFATKRD